MFFFNSQKDLYNCHAHSRQHENNSYLNISFHNLQLSNDTIFKRCIYTYLFAVCADRKFTNFDGRIYKIIEMKQIFVYRAHTQTAHNKNSKSNFTHTHIPYFTRSSIIQQSFLFRFSLCFCFCFFHCPFVRRAFIQGLDFYSYE